MAEMLLNDGGGRQEPYGGGGGLEHSDHEYWKKKVST